MHDLHSIDVIIFHVAGNIDRGKVAAPSFVDQLITTFDKVTDQVPVHTLNSSSGKLLLSGLHYTPSVR